MKLATIILIFLIMLITQTESYSQAFNIRTRLQLPAIEFNNIHQSNDTIFLTGIGTKQEFSYKFKLLFASFLTDGTYITSNLLALDTLSDYATFDQNSSLLVDNKIMILGAGGLTTLTDTGYITVIEKGGDFIYQKAFTPDDGSTNQIVKQMIKVGNVYYAILLESDNIFQFSIRLVKMDSELNTIWEKNYKDEDKYWEYHPEALTIDQQGNILIGMKMTLFNSINADSIDNVHSVVWKLDTSGVVLDTFRSKSYLHGVNAIVPTDDGGCIFVDREVKNVEEQEYVARIVKLDNNLEKEWTKIVGPQEYRTELFNIIKTNDGNYVAIGIAMDTITDNPCVEAVVIKISEEGYVFWDNRVCHLLENANLDDNKTITRNILYDLIELDEGGFIGTGASIITQADSFPQQGWIIRLNAEGEYVNSFDLPTFSDHQQLDLYPNPASNQVVVSLHQEKIDQIRVYNSQGKLQYQHSHTYDSGHTIDVSNLQAGLYYIQVNGEYVEKLMVVK